MIASDTQIWITIVLLGIGTFFVRFSFLGLLGDKQLPDWALRHLRYTAVAILPALVAPLVLWSDSGDGLNDPARLAAGLATLLVGVFTKSTIWAIVAGGVVLASLQALAG